MAATASSTKLTLAILSEGLGLLGWIYHTNADAF
jgi:hypothetical protein